MNAMKYVLIIGFAMLSCTAHASEVRFFETLQDVPVMDGLVEQVDETLIFDKPDGRVVESVAYMDDKDAKEVRHYYAQTLPQFGWSASGSDRFVRHEERLEMVFETHQNIQIVRFLIQPR